MPRIHANHLDLYYERAGDGPPLLFISGTGGDLRVKPNVFDGGLGRAFDLIAYDQRGLGQSEKPDRAYSMADYADDAAGLLDALGVDSIKVVGVSFGGMVAQELALRHPGKVERLVLACTSPGGAGLKHHLIPVTWVESIEDDKVRLNLTKDAAKAGWREKH